MSLFAACGETSQLCWLLRKAHDNASNSGLDSHARKSNVEFVGKPQASDVMPLSIPSNSIVILAGFR